MKTALKIIFSIHAALVSVAAAFSQPVRINIGVEKTARLDSFLQTMADNGLFNGSVLVAQKGQVVYKRSAGYYSREEKIVNGTTTPFNLASLSKPFTSLAVLQLVQQKKLYFDDSVSAYLPDFPFRGITIRHLLTHTSGLPQIEKIEAQYAKDHPKEIVSPAKAYQDLRLYRDSLPFRAGERFQYNNTNYFLLSFIIEKASGHSFARYMARNIFGPAGMKHTFIRHEKRNTPRYIRPTLFATRYEPVDSLDPGEFYTYFQLGGLPGPNNVISTVEDLARFDAALASGRLVDTALLAEAFMPATLTSGRKVSLGGARRYGMGWNVMDEPGKDKVVFHDGHVIGLTTMLYKNLTKAQSIIFYDNTESPAFFQKVGTIARILNDEPLNPVSLKKSAVREFGQTLVSKGWSGARAKLEELRSDSTRYYFAELEMNSLGYDLLYHSTVPEHKAWSLEVFKMNVLLYPTHSNVYDSYGEALLQNGQKEEAIKMYQKVLELEPAHENAKRTLASLGK